MTNTTRPIVYIVVGTLAFVFAGYAATLCALTFTGGKPDLKVLEYLKDAGIFAAGALSAVLAQTRNPSDTNRTEIVNQPNNPVPVEPQP